MALNSRRSNSSVDKRETLMSIPVMRDAARVCENNRGTTHIEIAVHRGHGFLDRFRPPVTERRYELDKFGSFVVDHIDGNASVLDIAGAFRDKFGMSRRECEMGVVAFVKLLMQRHVIDVLPGRSS